MSKKPTPASLPKSVAAALPSAAGFVRDLGKVVRHIDTIAREMEVARGDPVHAARAFVVLHRLVERCEELMNPLYALHTKYRTSEMPQLFEQAGIGNIPLIEGFRVQLTSRFVASIKAGEKDRAYQWLRDNGMGDIIQGTVNASTLSASLRELTAENNLDPPADLFNVAYLSTVSVVSTK